MKKRMRILLIQVLMLMTACSQNQSPNQPASTIPPPSFSPEQSLIDEGSADSKILVAYFTWAENTVVVDAKDSVQSALSHYESIGDASAYEGTDVSSSASVINPGNTAVLAQAIERRTGADLFSIVVNEPYPSNYDECLDRASEEKASSARPSLVNQVENMQQYDVVFLGFPNWWYTLPMAIHSFIEENDLSNKTVIPFVTHGTGGLSATIRDLSRVLPESTELLDAFHIYRADMQNAESEINAWLDELGYEENASSMNNGEETNGRQIRFIVQEKEYQVTLADTPAANSLYDRLPLELVFEDYNNIEKIAYLDETLNTENEPSGFDPEPGDLCLYAPWGNLSLFYQDFRYSEGLISLGKLESGIDALGAINEDFTIRIEKAE